MSKLFNSFIFYHQQRYCISTEAYFVFMVVLVLLQLSLSFISYVISCVLLLISPLRYNSNFSFFITNDVIRKKNCQLINYNSIKTTKSEPTFGKSSIHNQSSLSNKKVHLTRYQL